MTTVGEGICQFDNTTRPAAESPANIKNIIEIRVMSFPYPLNHCGPLILASVFGLSFWPQFLATLVLTHAILADSNRNYFHPKDERLKTIIKSQT
jgi:hypothetical protein